MDEKPLTSAGHEPTDVSIRVVWIGLPVIVLGVMALSLLVLQLYPGGTKDRTLQLPLPSYPEPQLQSDPVRDMQAFRGQQQAQLEGMHWIDREHGIVHIPIEEAMHAIARDGIADWPVDEHVP